MDLGAEAGLVVAQAGRGSEEEERARLGAERGVVAGFTAGEAPDLGEDVGERERGLEEALELEQLAPPSEGFEEGGVDGGVRRVERGAAELGEEGGELLRVVGVEALEVGEREVRRRGEGEARRVAWVRVALVHHGVGGEGLAGELRREGDEALLLAVVVRGAAARLHGRAGPDAGNLAEVDVAVGLEAADQARDLRAEHARVGVDLVEDEVARLDALEEAAVLLAQEELLQHRVVGEQDVGRALRQLAAVVALLLGGVLGARVGAGGGLVERGVARVAAERHAGAAELPAQADELVVREGVHRVDDDGADGSGRGAAEALVDDGDDEGFGLAGAGARGDEGVAWPLRGREAAHGLGLMPVEGVEAPRRLRRRLGEDALGDEIGEGCAAGVGAGEGDERVAPEEALVVDEVGEARFDRGTADREAGLDVAAVGLAKVLDGDEGLHGSGEAEVAEGGRRGEDHEVDAGAAQADVEERVGVGRGEVVDVDEDHDGALQALEAVDALEESAPRVAILVVGQGIAACFVRAGEGGFGRRRHR